MVAEAGNLDSGLGTGLENRVGPIHLGRLPVDVDIEFVVECLRGAELWQQG